MDDFSERNSELKKAIEQVRKAYGGDADLVRPLAEEHGVQVVEGTSTDTEMSKGDYHPRIPDETKDIPGIMTADGTVIVCPDGRQAAEVVKEMKRRWGENLIVLAGAGGPDQPDKSREDAGVAFAAASHEAHSGKVGGVFHLKGCGGVMASSEEMKRIVEAGKWEKEEEEMTRLGRRFMRRAIEAGVPKEQAHLYVARIGEDDEYERLDEIPIFEEEVEVEG